jgi:hypothetical protein
MQKKASLQPKQVKIVASAGMRLRRGMGRHHWMESSCGLVDYPQVLDRPVVICPRLFDW